LAALAMLLLVGRPVRAAPSIQEPTPTPGTGLAAEALPGTRRTPPGAGQWRAQVADHRADGVGHHQQRQVGLHPGRLLRGGHAAQPARVAARLVLLPHQAGYPLVDAVGVHELGPLVVAEAPSYPGRGMKRAGEHPGSLAIHIGGRALDPAQPHSAGEEVVSGDDVGPHPVAVVRLVPYGHIEEVSVAPVDVLRHRIAHPGRALLSAGLIVGAEEAVAGEVYSLAGPEIYPAVLPQRGVTRFAPRRDAGQGVLDVILVDGVGAVHPLIIPLVVDRHRAAVGAVVGQTSIHLVVARRDAPEGGPGPAAAQLAH